MVDCGPARNAGAVANVSINERFMNTSDIGSKRQFWFNAQDLVAESSLLRVLQQRPVKHPQNPILVADRPWEGMLVQLYSADVHHDPKTGKWQMWYEGHPQELLVC